MNGTFRPFFSHSNALLTFQRSVPSSMIKAATRQQLQSLLKIPNLCESRRFVHPVFDNEEIIGPQPTAFDVIAGRYRNVA
jgi:hypothetical protein